MDLQYWTSFFCDMGFLYIRSFFFTLKQYLVIAFNNFMHARAVSDYIALMTNGIKHTKDYLYINVLLSIHFIRFYIQITFALKYSNFHNSTYPKFPLL